MDSASRSVPASDARALPPPTELMPGTIEPVALPASDTDQEDPIALDWKFSSILDRGALYIGLN